jgi:CubicO group peptidase (beta-lactamase class C family)
MRIIEMVSGVPYEAYVREEILEPLSIHSMRIGKNPAEERTPARSAAKAVRTILSDAATRRRLSFQARVTGGGSCAR